MMWTTQKSRVASTSAAADPEEQGRLDERGRGDPEVAEYRGAQQQPDGDADE
jgi:hypothetical protein